MTITMKHAADTLTLTLTGRLDTTTAPQLEKALQENLDGIHSITFDFAGIEYISSAGLRVLLSTQKQMNAAAGTMKLIHANEMVMEVFDITGFADILTIE